MVCTIHAKDDALGKAQLNEILNNKYRRTDMMNTQEFDCLDVDIDQVIDYCFTAPFFAEYKVAILRNPIFLTGEKTKRDYTEFVDKLMHYLENENKTTILIIYSLYEKLDDRKNIVKKLKKEYKFISLGAPNTIEMGNIIKRQVNKVNASIEDKAIERLIELVGADLVNINSEVEKLVLYKPDETITKKDVEEFVVYNSESTIFDLSDTILSRNGTRSLELYDELIKSGMETVVLTNILANQIRIALLSQIYQEQGLQQAAIAKKLKVHPYRVRLSLKLKYSAENLKEILVKLAALDYNIKIGKVNKHQGMKLLILSI
jgi:DNA polymerase III subunit delta